MDAMRGGPRVGGVAPPVAPPGAVRALLAPEQRFAGLTVRPPAGAGASDGDDGDDAVRCHGFVDGRPGGSPSSTKDEKKDAGKEPGAGA